MPGMDFQRTKECTVACTTWHGLRIICYTYLIPITTWFVKLTANNNRLSTLAGTPNQKGFSGDNGLAEKAKLDTPISISLTPDEKTLLIADIRNRRIRAVDLNSGIIRTIAGNGKKENPLTANSPWNNH